MKLLAKKVLTNVEDPAFYFIYVERIDEFRFYLLFGTDEVRLLLYDTWGLRILHKRVNINTKITEASVIMAIVAHFNYLLID